MIVTLLCARCSRQLGPRKPRPAIVRDALRKAADGMTRPADPQAERIKARKERRAELRKAFREEGPTGAVRLFLSGSATQAPVSEECPDCQSLMARRRVALPPRRGEVAELNFDHNDAA